MAFEYTIICKGLIKCNLVLKSLNMSINDYQHFNLIIFKT